MKSTTKIAGLTFMVMALSLGMIGLAGAQSVTSVLGSYTGSYTPATCTLGTNGQTSIALSSTPQSMLVGNTGTADSNGVPSAMTVTVSFNDNGAGLGAGGGWYTGYSSTPSGSWVDSLEYGSSMVTYWTSDQSGYASTPTYPVLAESLLAGSGQGSVYSPLYSAGGKPAGSGWMPISLSVTAPSGIPSGTTYYQQIVLSGSC